MHLVWHLHTMRLLLLSTWGPENPDQLCVRQTQQQFPVLATADPSAPHVRNDTALLDDAQQAQN